MALVGIDLGTTNSLVSVWKGGKVELLKNSLGNLMTPSVVGLNDDGNVLVGEVARQRRVSHPDLTAAEFKRTMGTETIYNLGDKAFSSEDLSAFLLRKMISDASEQLGEPVTEAVISVPAYFDDNQREATKRAAQIAGISVKRLINEPSAAVLYSQWKKGNEGMDGIYLVVDFGGGTLDISVVDCFENIIEIIAVSGDNQLGGKDFDHAIALDFCSKCGLTFSQLSNVTRQSILWAAENVKKTLSTADSATMHILINNKSYEHIYTNEELLQATAEVLSKIKAIINDAINGAKITTDRIVDIILVGGSCKMPLVQRYLSALFHRTITADDDIDYYVGYGTGVLTGIIKREGEISDIVMTDVCPFSLGVGTSNKEHTHFYMSVIIPKNTILPTSKSSIYAGLVPFQKRIDFEIFQGEEMHAKSNLSLGTFSLDVCPNENGDTLVEVTFSYDINGLLEVRAKDLYGPNKLETTILSKNSQLTEEEVATKRAAMNNEMVLEKDKEENRSIMAWAQRLHAQADEENKQRIITVIRHFATALENNDIINIARAKKYVLQQLLQLEILINRNHFEDNDIISGMLSDMKVERLTKEYSNIDSNDSDMDDKE
ncbi:MAG: Hsp70 family protein [Lachnospira sp.]|nr:Hsp70 family protein [Lachnospira sp.]